MRLSQQHRGVGSGGYNARVGSSYQIQIFLVDNFNVSDAGFILSAQVGIYFTLHVILSNYTQLVIITCNVLERTDCKCEDLCAV